MGRNKRLNVLIPEDTQDFIREAEASARKVLTNLSQRKNNDLEDLKAYECRAASFIQEKAKKLRRKAPLHGNKCISKNKPAKKLFNTLRSSFDLENPYSSPVLRHSNSLPCIRRHVHRKIPADSRGSSNESDNQELKSDLLTGEVSSLNFAGNNCSLPIIKNWKRNSNQSPNDLPNNGNDGCPSTNKVSTSIHPKLTKNPLFLSAKVNYSSDTSNSGQSDMQLVRVKTINRPHTAGPCRSRFRKYNLHQKMNISPYAAQSLQRESRLHVNSHERFTPGWSSTNLRSQYRCISAFYSTAEQHPIYALHTKMVKDLTTQCFLHAAAHDKPRPLNLNMDQIWKKSSDRSLEDIINFPREGLARRIDLNSILIRASQIPSVSRARALELTYTCEPFEPPPNPFVPWKNRPIRPSFCDSAPFSEVSVLVHSIPMTMSPQFRLSVIRRKLESEPVTWCLSRYNTNTLLEDYTCLTEYSALEYISKTQRPLLFPENRLSQTKIVNLNATINRWGNVAKESADISIQIMYPFCSAEGVYFEPILSIEACTQCSNREYKTPCFLMLTIGDLWQRLRRAEHLIPHNISFWDTDDGILVLAALISMIRLPSVKFELTPSLLILRRDGEGNQEASLLSTVASCLLSMTAIGSDGKLFIYKMSKSALHKLKYDAEEQWVEEANRPLALCLGRGKALPWTCCLSNCSSEAMRFLSPTKISFENRMCATAKITRNDTSGALKVSMMMSSKLPILSEHCVAWNSEQIAPPPISPPSEPYSEVVGKYERPLSPVLHTLCSPLVTKCAPTCMLLSSAETEEDWNFESIEAERFAIRAGMHHLRRNLIACDTTWRSAVLAPVPAPCDILEAKTFGISEHAIQPNAPRMYPPMTYHSDYCFTDELYSKKTGEDYIGSSVAHSTQGQGIACLYRVRVKYDQFDSLIRTNVNDHRFEIANMEEAANLAAKTASLKKRIEIGSAQLAARRWQEQVVKNENRRAENSNSENLFLAARVQRRARRWEKKLKMSDILEVRGEWEMRKDTGGSVFFYNATEAGPSRFSCGQPLNWDSLSRINSIPQSNETIAKRIAKLAVNELDTNDELVEQLARRLGIPKGRICPSGDPPNRARETNYDTQEQILDSDDDLLSDKYYEKIDSGCNFSNLPPQDHRPNIKHFLNIEKFENDSMHVDIPTLPLNRFDKKNSLEKGGISWQNLDDKRVEEGILGEIHQGIYMGQNLDAFSDTGPELCLTEGFDPLMAPHEEHFFSMEPKKIFVTNLVEEYNRIQQGAVQRMAHEKIMENMEDFDVSKLANRGPQAYTTAEIEAMTLDCNEKITKNAESTYEASEHRAHVACTTGNMEVLEMELEDGVDVDSADNMGNTLLLLACRQGNRRMAKFLLRRGATLNAQNLAGNGALHFCHKHGHLELADYLLSKGADDALLNQNGLTCYEGMSREELQGI